MDLGVFGERYPYFYIGRLIMTFETVLVLFFVFGIIMSLFASANNASVYKIPCKKHNWKINLAGGHYCETCKLDTRESLGKNESGE